MVVFVTGGTGYVGLKIIDTLLSYGHEVVALERPNSSRPIHNPLVRVVRGDIFETRELAKVMSQASVQAVIHLVGIIRELHSQGITMHRMHVEATESVIEAAQQAGVSKFVHMSALGARANARSNYHISKWSGEERVRDSGLTYTIFRPSVIFGRGGNGPNFIDMLKDLVLKAPVIPIIGDGHYPLQPVSIHTVAEAFTKAIHISCGKNKTLELCGPDVVTYKQVLEMIAARINKETHTIPIPVFLMKALVPMLQRMPRFPLTKDQLTMLLEGNVCKNCTICHDPDFQLEEIPFEIL